VKFLGSVVFYDVISRAGIHGPYSFDVDWSSRLKKDIRGLGPGTAPAGVKRLGLKLEAAKEMREVLAVNRMEESQPQTNAARCQLKRGGWSVQRN
jgi:uncharacterized protein (TIGR03435 family)